MPLKTRIKRFTSGIAAFFGIICVIIAAFGGMILMVVVIGGELQTQESSISIIAAKEEGAHKPSSLVQKDKPKNNLRLSIQNPPYTSDDKSHHKSLLRLMKNQNHKEKKSHPMKTIKEVPTAKSAVIPPGIRTPTHKRKSELNKLPTQQLRTEVLRTNSTQIDLSEGHLDHHHKRALDKNRET